MPSAITDIFGGDSIPEGQFNKVNIPGSPFTPLSNFNVTGPGFDFTGGLNDGNLNTNFSVSGTPERNLANETFTGNIGALDELGETVRPGFSDIREARTSEIERGRERALGTVRSNLADRRIRGSGFATAAEGQVEAEAGQQQANARAQSFIDELNANRAIIADRGANAAQLYDTFIREANLGAGLTGTLGNLASQSQNLANQLEVNQAIAESQVQLQRDIAEAEREAAAIKAFTDLVGTAVGASTGIPTGGGGGGTPSFSQGFGGNISPNTGNFSVFSPPTGQTTFSAGSFAGAR